MAQPRWAVASIDPIDRIDGIDVFFFVHGRRRGEPQQAIWLWLSTPMGSHFGVDAPPILEPILVGIGMFTWGTGF